VNLFKKSNRIFTLLIGCCGLFFCGLAFSAGITNIQVIVEDIKSNGGTQQSPVPFDGDPVKEQLTPYLLVRIKDYKGQSLHVDSAGVAKLKSTIDGGVTVSNNDCYRDPDGAGYKYNAVLYLEEFYNRRGDQAWRAFYNALIIAKNTQTPVTLDLLSEHGSIDGEGALVIPCANSNDLLPFVNQVEFNI